jgi:hypothetical protein
MAAMTGNLGFFCAIVLPFLVLFWCLSSWAQHIEQSEQTREEEKEAESETEDKHALPVQCVVTRMTERP